MRSPRDLFSLLQSKEINPQKIVELLNYENELQKLQIELVKLQCWVQEKKRRVAILFEGRDAAGKGGAIRRFTDHMHPRALRVVAWPKPTEEEVGQWYFQRYTCQLPNRGEIVFFDRSWYNRAVVESVNGFCAPEQYEQFIRQVTEYKHRLYEDSVTLIKFWFLISKEEQKWRFDSRADNPLKQWKISLMDAKSQAFWDSYTKCKELMFSKVYTSFSPWIVVRDNNKKNARPESICYVLSVLEYVGKNEATILLQLDLNIIKLYRHSTLEFGLECTDDIFCNGWGRQW